MATLKSVIDYVDEIKPNAFSNEAKTKWLNECEGLVQTEVLLWASEEIITYQYDANGNGQRDEILAVSIDSFRNGIAQWFDLPTEVIALDPQ